MIDTAPLTAVEAFRRKMPNKARLYVAGCSGEPFAVAEAFRANPDLANGLTFVGIWIPGINTTDWASLHHDAGAETIFMSRHLRPSFESGKTQFLPLSYTSSVVWLRETPLDGAVIMVSPPDRNGELSLGVSADFSSIVADRPDIPLLALINPNMPFAHDGPSLPIDRFAAICTADNSLIQAPGADLPETFSSIGKHIAALVDNGDVLQLGLGNVQQAALQSLQGHRSLKIHSGMVSDPVLGLIKAGALSEAKGAITTGVAIGTNDLYRQIAVDPRVSFRPVSYTHNISTLAAIENFKAINSVIEVDLFGQANAEFINGRQVSGTGGLVDFLTGAKASPGGRAIVALASTTKQGQVSRIVPCLPSDPTSITRSDLETVVTEHGVADLKHKTLDQRADALISIADPVFRDTLSNQWARMRGAM